ncbi:UNVERIFIED_CONTAM: hypothetical protein GTU68_055432 [Idotea baltica]|nr:hypothetical protein [Idotea baltica]
MLASFAAKPFDDLAGSGLHVHFSVKDQTDQNIFDDRTEAGSPLLHHALAGCLETMAAATLVFAPHGASYDRLVPNAHAPTGVAWGYENRTTALRVPGGAFAARRIEHRVAGVDANPYLLLTAILGAAWIGIEDKMTPPPPVTGNAYDHDLRQIPDSWAKAIDFFATQPLIKRIFPPMLIDNLVRTKRQELSKAATINPSHLRAIYLSLL